MTRLIGMALAAAAGPRLRAIERWRRDPVPTQERLLLDLLRRAANTAFGREHGFDSIRTADEYRRRVPLRSYLDFKPYWDRSFAGESDVTWPGRIREFAMTSGTTAGNKYIPVSDEGAKCHQQAGRDLLSFYFSQTRHNALFSGKFLFLGGSTVLKQHPHGVLDGDLSGILARRFPFYTRFFRLPSPDAAAMSDWEAKLDAIADESWRADVRGIGGTPSWLVCLFERIFRRRRDAGLPADTLAQVWPNLALYVHGGVSFEPYRETFRSLFGKEVTTMEVYPASEGFMAVQDVIGSRDLLLLMDNGLYFEFIPAAEAQAKSPTRLTVADVEKDVDYAILLTTNSGIWSYMIGDTVRFTSLRPHRLRVTGRTHFFLNAFGEHVIVEELERAMTAACEATGAAMQDFHVAPIFAKSGDMRPAHEWLVEFRRPPQDAERFRDLLDRTLQGANEDYAAHRQGNAGMRAPVLTPLPHDAFYRAMKQIGRFGAQNKAPRLANTRDFAEVLVGNASPQGPR
jgi:hypothetical protein